MTKFFLLIALCIVAAVCAEVASFDHEAQFKKFAAFQESFLKASQTLGANGNLRPMASNAGSYGVYQIFNGGSCSGTPAYAAANGLGVCMPGYGGGSVQAVSANNQITVTVYTDANCQQNPTVATQIPTGTCSSLTVNGVSASFNVVTQSSASPTYSVNGALQTYYDTTADCNSQSPAVYGWLYYQTSSNGCVNYSSSSSGSSSFTCSGGNYVVTAYTQANCAGTGSASGSVPSNALCSTAVSTLAGAQGYAYMGCYTAPATSSSSSSCFAGSESIMLESGATVPISEVRVGDKVLAYSSAAQSTVFSDVIAVPHGQNNIKANFQHIAMESGADIKMTAEHLLPAGACSLASLPLARAADVQVGDCVQTTEGVSRVVSNNVVSDEGIYTIVTNADYVVVNGVVASPFAVNHAVANFMYGIHRMVYAVAPKMVAPLSGVMSNLAAYFTK